jgi:hypothetical protein
MIIATGDDCNRRLLQNEIIAAGGVINDSAAGEEVAPR